MHLALPKLSGYLSATHGKRFKSNVPPRSYNILLFSKNKMLDLLLYSWCRPLREEWVHEKIEDKHPINYIVLTPSGYNVFLLLSLYKLSPGILWGNSAIKSASNLGNLLFFLASFGARSNIWLCLCPSCQKCFFFIASLDFSLQTLDVRLPGINATNSFSLSLSDWVSLSCLTLTLFYLVRVFYLAWKNRVISSPNWNHRKYCSPS